MIAIDGAHAPTRPEPSSWKGKRGKGEWKEVKGFRTYLINTDNIIHLISWHQVQNDKEWVEATFVRPFHNQITGVIRGINRMKPTSPEAKKKIKDVVRYLSNHKEKVNYGAAKRGGYHIGSGAIESANKFIAHVRLKRSGAWWYISNANNILKLRCAKYNGTYDRIIQKYKKLDREKVYAKFNLANSM